MSKMHLWEVYLEIDSDTSPKYHKGIVVATNAFLAFERFVKSRSFIPNTQCTRIRVTPIHGGIYHVSI